ncbi:MAG TPA: ATP synthase F1 subunit epsilon [Firmicutes bacterium]|nr:ATP synthase F1 subunit epsilon [Bacillota bacterium]
MEVSRDDIDMVVAPGIEGDVGFLPGHLPFMTRLRTGVLRYYIGDDMHVMAVSEGYLEVTPAKVIVLAEAAEMPEDIDVQKALESKRKAEAILAAGTYSPADINKATASLRRALLRLKIAEQTRDDE